jgi:predicted ferric reductase
MMVAGIWWFLSRSSGLVAAILLVVAFVWGIMLSTQLVKPVKRAAWLLDLHRWLGGLTIGFVAIHVFSLIADSYVEFNLASIFLPFASEWRTTAVTWGVAGLYLLVAIQLTSWLPIRARLSRRTWRGIHFLSFPLLWIVAMHSAAAGTDVTNPAYVFGVLVLVNLAVFVVLYRILAGKGRARRAANKRDGAAQPSLRLVKRP